MGMLDSDTESDQSIRGCDRWVLENSLTELHRSRRTDSRAIAPSPGEYLERYWLGRVFVFLHKWFHRLVGCTFMMTGMAFNIMGIIIAVGDLNSYVVLWKPDVHEGPAKLVMFGSLALLIGMIWACYIGKAHEDCGLWRRL